MPRPQGTSAKLEPPPRPLWNGHSYAHAIVQTVRQPLVVLDKDLRVKSANRAFCETFRVSPEETQGRLVYELGNSQWDIPKLRRFLEEAQRETEERFRTLYESSLDGIAAADLDGYIRECNQAYAEMTDAACQKREAA